MDTDFPIYPCFRSSSDSFWNPVDKQRMQHDMRPMSGLLKMYKYNQAVGVVSQVGLVYSSLNRTRVGHYVFWGGSGKA